MSRLDPCGLAESWHPAKRRRERGAGIGCTCSRMRRDFPWSRRSERRAAGALQAQPQWIVEGGGYGKDYTVSITKLPRRRQNCLTTESLISGQGRFVFWADVDHPGTL
jgi:hypothetical protein